MHILLTGCNGFIGKNLNVRLSEIGEVKVITYTRKNSIRDLPGLVAQVDAVIHLAGENRPVDDSAFALVNTHLTQSLCDAIRSTGRHIPVVLASSIQAEYKNPYGISKRAAEIAIEELAVKTGNPVYIYRLPGVFGKWCKPNYNSVVATFCHNIANDLPVMVNDESQKIKLVYVDDVVSDFLNAIQRNSIGVSVRAIEPEYTITLGELAEQIKGFKKSRQSLVIDNVGTGFCRALYSTYVSYLPPEQFSYPVAVYGDERGIFAEMLKTKDSGQFSFFTAPPGVTRGGHYHNSKTEKFLVIKGSALFKFRNIITNEMYQVSISGDKPQVVDTVPGWTHDITNVGEDEMIVMLWANEVFDRDNPDTIACEV